VAEASCQNGQGNAIPPQEITRRWYYAIAACIILFVFQALWTVGSNLLSALPTPPADEATIIRVITKASASAEPTEQGSLDYSLWVIRRQNAVEELTAWVNLTEPLDFDDWKWLPWSQPSNQRADLEAQLKQAQDKLQQAQQNADLASSERAALEARLKKAEENLQLAQQAQPEHPEPSTPTDLIKKVASKKTLSTDSIDQIIASLNWEDTLITEAKNRMDLLQQFILPLLYGWIGSLVYILRSSSEQIRLSTYRKEDSVLCDLRMLLGMVAGLAIGWFFKPSGTEVNGVGLVSPFALAFLAGYSVDLLFTVMDRVVATFSKAVPMEPPGRTPAGTISSEKAS
jgi:hypothetical protein